MSVVDRHVALLSNYEVYALLGEVRRNSHGKKHRGPQNLATIVYETAEYLGETPCKDQSPEIIQRVLKALQPYKLTKAEKLQLLNLRPSTDVEFHMIVAECEERFTEAEMKAIMEITQMCLSEKE